jgi:hypothetical protein
MTCSPQRQPTWLQTIPQPSHGNRCANRKTIDINGLKGRDRSLARSFLPCAAILADFVERSALQVKRTTSCYQARLPV